MEEAISKGLWENLKVNFMVEWTKEKNRLEKFITKREHLLIKNNKPFNNDFSLKHYNKRLERINEKLKGLK